MSERQPTGVLLLNLGGPATLADVRGFIASLLGDKEVLTLPAPLRVGLANLIAWRRAPRVRTFYQAIGGGSPIGRLTRDQVDALASALGDGFVVTHAFRHSPPRAARALAELAAAGARRVVVLPLYPQWSGSTTGSGVAEVEREAAGLGLELVKVGSYPAADGFIEALAAHTRPLISDGCVVVATAHGLPQRTVDRGDPYVGDVRATFAALAAALPAGTRCTLAFQSRLGPVEWTRPYLVDEVQRLAREGVTSLVVVPLSFVSENLETLYELDVELAHLAAAAGVTSFRRAPVVGCHPAFVATLADLVRRAASVKEGKHVA